TVHFSEPVFGFTGTDLTLGGGTLTAGSFSANANGQDFTFTVTPSAQEGTVTVEGAAGVAHDAAGNNNTAAAQVARTVDSARRAPPRRAPCSAASRRDQPLTHPGERPVRRTGARVYCLRHHGRQRHRHGQQFHCR